jgi:hypothetical protein
MNTTLPALLRKAAPAAILLAITGILTGCGPEQDTQFFPYMHNASVGPSSQLVGIPPIDIRHHAHALHIATPHRHAPPTNVSLPK